MADPVGKMEPWDKKIDRIRGLAATDPAAFYAEVGVKMVYDPNDSGWPFHGLENAFYAGQELYTKREAAKLASDVNTEGRSKESELVSRMEVPVTRARVFREVREANEGFLCPEAVLQRIEALDISAINSDQLVKYRELAARDLLKCGRPKSEFRNNEEWEAEAMKSWIWGIRMEAVDDKHLGFLTRSLSGTYDYANANRVYNALRAKLIGNPEQKDP